jgi:2-polyprenyl-3-methyl-5-hydroxy-6-metoxy-1,4-benzoquinol methylase
MKILSESFSFKYKDGNYDYHYILENGAIRLNPLPAEEIIQYFYPAEYGNYNIRTKNAYPAKKIMLAKWRNAIYLYPNFRNYILKLVAISFEVLLGRRLTPSLGIPFSMPKNSKILDVGYGGGEYLLSLKDHGFTNLHGYDIDQNFHSKRLIVNAINIYSGNFKEIEIEDSSVDLIRLEHVFEHLRNPLENLEVIFKKLKPEGILVMTYPTYHNPIFYLSPLSFPHLDSPRHIFLHSRKSTISNLQTAGFTILDCKYQPCFNVFLAAFPKLKNNKLTKAIEVFFGPIYLILLTFFRMGEQINVVAKK